MNLAILTRKRNSAQETHKSVVVDVVPFKIVCTFMSLHHPMDVYMHVYSENSSQNSYHQIISIS